MTKLSRRSFLKMLGAALAFPVASKLPGLPQSELPKPDKSSSTFLHHSKNVTFQMMDDYGEWHDISSHATKFEVLDSFSIDDPVYVDLGGKVSSDARELRFSCTFNYDNDIPLGVLLDQK